jgi:inorganic pyrophosphatase
MNEIMIVEIPKGSLNKFEIREGKIVLDRVLSSSMVYPQEYGFIPETLCEDGDELDVVCITNVPTFPGCIIPIEILGVLEMEDQGKRDDKIIAINKADKRLYPIENLKNSSILEEIISFFKFYKNTEKKSVIIGDFKDIDEALKIIKSSKEKYLNQNIKKE